MSTNTSFHTSVAIIGGGFSGTLLAVNMIKNLPFDCHVHMTLIDKTGQFACGVAYSTSDPHHLLNVRADKMGAFSDEPEHFFKWVKANEELCHRLFPTLKLDAESFLPRKLYALYLQSLFEQAKDEARQKKINLVLITAKVIDLVPFEEKEMKIILDSGSIIYAKAAVLSTNLPSNQVQLDASSGCYIANVWNPPPNSFFLQPKLDHLSSHTRIAMIGSGLTMVDAAISLIYRGYRGEMIAISKHGQLPKSHQMKADLSSVSFDPEKIPYRALSLFHYIRRAVEVAESNGIDWRVVLDALRPMTNVQWEKMDLHEKKRFRRHILNLWHHCRHRIPHEIYQTIETYRLSGKIRVLKGCVTSVQKAAKSQRLVVIAEQPIEVDYVINCSGPQVDITKSNCSLIQRLLEQQLIEPHPLKMGLVTDSDFKVIGKKDLPLYALGMLLFGQKLETVAVPELREQCFCIANEISRYLLTENVK